MEKTTTSPAPASLPYELTIGRNPSGCLSIYDSGGTPRFVNRVAVLERRPNDEETGRFIIRACNAHEPLRRASQTLYDRMQEFLDVSDEQLIERGYGDLVKAMDEMEAAWHKADGTVSEENDGKTS